MFLERLALQICILVGAGVPVAAGLAGAIFGGQLTGDFLSPSGDNHYRYMSGLLLGIGLLYWTAVPHIERMTRRIRILTIVVMIGGIARLQSLIFWPTPDTVMLVAVAMELLVTPMLCVWQSRIATRMATVA
jgi:hypothetical protein